MRHHYLEERLPIAEIAAFFGFSVGTIGDTRRVNILIRPDWVVFWGEG